MERFRELPDDHITDREVNDWFDSLPPVPDEDILRITFLISEESKRETGKPITPLSELAEQGD